MKVALCCIGRLENQYAVEFVEHYKQLGFDKIFIYDNNHDGEEHFEDVLQPYIGESFIEITDFRNKEAAQLLAYNDCYNKHGNEYDWIAFFDFDEFLTLVEDKDIHSFLSHFEDCDVVKINWMVYTDNDLVINDHRPLLERFTTPMEYDKCITYNFSENNHVKSIIRGGITDFNWCGQPHTPNIQLKYIDSVGSKSDNSPFQPYNFSKAYIKHFITKTIDEWINNKLIRGAGDRSHKTFGLTYTIDKFFKYNNKTREKLDFIEREKYLDIFICTHKKFIPIVSSSAYKIINSKVISPNLPLDNKWYSELYHFKYVNDNEILKKYVGFCHYRRYFSFLDDIPNLDKIFDKFDCIVASPLNFNTTVREQYKNLHNIEDLEIVENIIKDKFTDYYEMCELFLNGKLFIPYNMFIMKSEDFKKYCEFVFGVLDEYIKIVGTNINKHIEDNKDKYIKDFYPNNTVEYQYRIGGYIAERLTNIFLMKHFKRMKIYPVIVTENKYNRIIKT